MALVMAAVIKRFVVGILIKATFVNSFFYGLDPKLCLV